MTTPRDPIYAGHRYPAEIISYAVWLYFRFPLILRMVEEMLAARGISVTHETIRQWGLKFGREFANRIRRRAPRRGDKWHLDEVVISFAGKKHWLWRAVDQDGFVLDVLVQSRRDKKAAKRLFRKLLKKQGRAPRVLVTDKLKSYAAAKREIMPGVEHRQHKGLNNRAENSHQPTRRRERIMKRFKSPRQVQPFLSAHDQVANLFPRPRDHDTPLNQPADRSGSVSRSSRRGRFNASFPPMTRSPTFSPAAETTTPPQTSGPAAPRPSPPGPTSPASPWLHNHAYRRASLRPLRFPSICRCQVDGAARVKNGPALAGHGAGAVRDAITRTITTLPEQLRRALTWDQGAELSQHAQLRIETGVQIYFCDPHSPWQRGTNENTNGLLRQYFPKGTDLSMHSVDALAAVAATLNGRPRKTLGWRTPAEALDELMKSAHTAVATTG